MVGPSRCSSIRSADSFARANSWRLAYGPAAIGAPAGVLPSSTLGMSGSLSRCRACRTHSAARAPSTPSLMRQMGSPWLL